MNNPEKKKIVLAEIPGKIIVISDSGVIENPVDIQWTLKNPVYLGKKLEAMVSVELNKYDSSTKQVYKITTNLLSTSSRESFARSLKGAFPNDPINWVLQISDLADAVEAHLSTKNSVVDLADVEEDVKKSWLVHPFITEGCENMIFGKGGTGKSYIAVALGMAVAKGIPFLGYKPSKKGNVLFVDYEDSASTFRQRIDSMSTSSEPPERGILKYFHPTSSLPDCADTLAAAVYNDKISLVIIDSVALACGGRPEDAEIAINYFNALRRLGVTTLSIAHETKSDGGNAYPFGSVFFHNSMRNIWNARSEQDEEGDTRTLGMFHRKCNNGRLLSPQGIKIHFDEASGKTSFSPDKTDMWEGEQSNSSRIYILLKNEGGMTRTQITRELGIPSGAVGTTLQRMREKGKIVKSGDSWSLNDGKPDIMGLPGLVTYN